MKTAPANSTGMSTAGRVSFWAPLAMVVLNFALLLCWPDLMARLDLRIPWAWRDVTIRLYDGWTLGCAVLMGLWLAFGTSRARWFIVPAVAGAGILVAIGGLHDTIFRRGLFWRYYLPEWGYLCLLTAQPIAGMHLLLHPLRVLLGWRLELGGAPDSISLRRRFQFRLHDLLVAMAGIAVALAVIRGAYTILVRSSQLNALGVAQYRLFCFGQILVPALACAWLILGHRKQWIGGFVLALALALPWFLVQTSWYTYLSTVPSQLWPAHWMNLGAVLCVAINLTPLRLCGLRMVVRQPASFDRKQAVARVE